MRAVNPMPPGLSLGILGGTFDPVHAGHLALARAALRALPLDAVIFLPAARSPFKTAAPGASAAHRLAMLALATARQPRFWLSDLEISGEPLAPRYTIDSLRRLKKQYRPARLWLLMGMDNLAGFPAWRMAAAILRLARLGVAGRPGSAIGVELPTPLLNRCDFFPLRRPVSSTRLRAALKYAGVSTPDCRALPACIRSYIEKNRLYRPKKNRR